MSEGRNDAESADDFIRDVLAALKPEEWSADEIADIERALESGEYDFPEWMTKLGGFENLAQVLARKKD